MIPCELAVYDYFEEIIKAIYLLIQSNTLA
jgi:hypothetical protein